MPEDFSAANAGAVDVAASTTPATSSTEPLQAQTPQTPQVTSATQEPAAQPDVTTTQAFARRLTQETTKAKDATIAELGYVDGQGNPITTYSAYQQAVQTAQQAERDAQLKEQTGVDPSTLKPLFEQWKETDPDFQSLKQERVKTGTENQILDLAKVFPELKIDRSKGDLGLPNSDEISKRVNEGLSLLDAYKLANFDTIKQATTASAQQSAISQILNNGASTPGSLAAPGQSPSTSVWDMADSDFKKLQQKALNGELMKS
jgi:hypothetical protein